MQSAAVLRDQNSGIVEWAASGEGLRESEGGKEVFKAERGAGKPGEADGRGGDAPGAGDPAHIAV